jgi:uncharacterized membrane protein HdeD (DUF308 family)
MGILAVILPHIATLAVQIFVGIILIISGIMYIAHALQVRKWRNILWEIFTAVLFLLTGILFLSYPFSGALAMTILLGIFFLIHGSLKIPLALAWRRRPGWGWILASAIFSIMLGIMVILGLPGTAVWLIGLLLGIDLIFAGLSSIALGSKLKNISL